MSRLIIENRTSLDDESALRCAMHVVGSGRISNDGKQYCYHSTLYLTGETQEIHVSAFKNKASDRLVVHYNDGEDRSTKETK